MKNSPALWLWILVVIAIGWLLYENDRKRRRLLESQGNDHRNKTVIKSLLAYNLLGQQNLVLQTQLAESLAARIVEPDAETQQIISQLHRLSEEFTNMAPAIAEELQAVGKMVRSDLNNPSLATLAKIIEVLLKKLFEPDAEFKCLYAKKKPNLGNLIDFARRKELFNDEELSCLNSLKNLRNSAVHDIGVKPDKAIMQKTLQEGVALIMRCKTFFTSPSYPGVAF